MKYTFCPDILNRAALARSELEQSHYLVQSHTDRAGGRRQYDYQLYQAELERLLAKTGAKELKIIPIGDSDAEGDFWVIPFSVLEPFLLPEHFAKSSTRADVQRWRFQVQDHSFVLYPGDRVRLGEIDVRQYYGAPLPWFQVYE